MATPEYARSDGNANHLIELFDTGRSQWLWRCVKCKSQSASAFFLTAFTCIPNDPDIDYAAAPDLLTACLAVHEMEILRLDGRVNLLLEAAIAKAKGA